VSIVYPSTWTEPGETLATTGARVLTRMRRMMTRLGVLDVVEQELPNGGRGGQNNNTFFGDRQRWCLPANLRSKTGWVRARRGRRTE
jgi:hypothetical protein